MLTEQVKNIILDMGNVLLDYNPNMILDRVCENEEEKAIIYKELFCGEDWIKGDLGEITNSQRYDNVKLRVPKELHYKLKECVEKWDICMLPVTGAQEFCKTVKEQGYKVYILSNACSKFYEYFPKHYDLDFFDGVVVSSDVHIIKPNVEIYNYLLDKYGIIPKECLFIDDRKENVEGAINAGMQSVVFNNNFDEILKILK